MMKNFPVCIILISLFNFSSYAQLDSVQVEMKFNQLEQQYQQFQEKHSETQNELQELSNRNNSLQRSIIGLSNKNEDLSSQLDSLNDLLIQNRNEVANFSQQLSEQKQELSGQIAETRETTFESVSELDKALSKNTLYWIIAVLVVGLLSLLAFFFLRKKVTDNQSSISESLASNRKQLEQETIQLDEKLIDIFNKQLEVLQANSNKENNSKDSLKELALKVADRLVIMEQNLLRMDEGTKGLKQLKKGIENIKANFSSNGFEIVDLLGKPFDERDKRIEPVIFKTDETLKSDERIITRIIKPLINFNQEPIQNAQVEVSQGE